MREAVSSVIAERAQDQGGLSRMLTFSLVAHAALLALLIVAPPQFSTPADTNTNAMTISISFPGAPGVDSGGKTALGDRPVQEAVPDAPKARPVPVAPPAPKAPAMTLPSPTKTKPRPDRKPVKQAPADARNRTPSQGTEVRQGSAVAETGTRGVGLGLSTGGEGGTAGLLDFGNFCCPDYIRTMLQLIRRNWNEKQGAAGLTVVKFTIQRDGRITEVLVEKPSGSLALDLASQRALLVTKQLPPLPAAFAEPYLTIRLNFEYQQ